MNEVLYYKANSGIMSFQGSMPYEVGAALGSGYEAAWAGTVENKYYISMKKDGISHLSYTTRRRGSGTERTAPRHDILRKGGILSTI